MRSARFAAYSFTVTFDEPLSVADPLNLGIDEKMKTATLRERHESDQPPTAAVPVTTDPWGRPIVRGTSIMGPLRAHFARYLLTPAVDIHLRSIDSRTGNATKTTRRATLADLVCGSEPEELTQGVGPTSKPNRALRPSPLRVVTAQLRSPVSAVSSHRTAINRCTGAGETHKLFGREALERAVVSVVLALDLTSLEFAIGQLHLKDSSHAAGESPSADQRAALVGKIISDVELALREWQPGIGGLRSTGVGAGKITDLTWGSADPLGLEELFGATDSLNLYRGIAAQGRSRATHLEVCQAAPTVDPWTIGVDLVAVDPLFVSPVRTPGTDRQNIRTGSDRVTGATWKGLIRSRAEFILRTCGVFACMSSTMPCGECPTCIIFGSTPEDGQGLADVGGSPGLVRFLNSAIIGGTDVHLDHVAIDRFTGGAADDKLYQNRSCPPGSTLSLTVSQRDRDWPVPEWARNLIVLAIRDITEGYVGVGNSTTRGYGTVHAKTNLPTVPDSWLDDMKRETTTKPYAEVRG